MAKTYWLVEDELDEEHTKEIIEDSGFVAIQVIKFSDVKEEIEKLLDMEFSKEMIEKFLEMGFDEDSKMKVSFSDLNYLCEHIADKIYWKLKKNLGLIMLLRRNLGVE